VSSTWRWSLAPAAAKQMAHLNEEVQRRIIDQLDLLVAGSRTVDTRKLEGEDGYRLRVGSYRVLYDVDKASRTFIVSKIADRKDAYR
jgi:mRNA interferase RelE/StbE